MWIIIPLLLLSIFWCCRKSYTSLQRHIRRWPGPLGLPFIGVLLKAGNLGVFHQTLTRWNKQYGKMFRFKLLGRRSIVLRSVSVVERALDNQRLTGRKSPFFQKYVFNDNSFAFASYEGKVPRLRELFVQVVYWDWELRETNDFGLELCIKKFKTKLLRARQSGFSPDRYIRNLMTDIFTCLRTSDDLLALVGRCFKRKARCLPGPSGLPFIGAYFQFDSNKVHKLFTDWSKEFGQIFKFSLLGRNIVVLNSSDLVIKAFEKGAISFHTNDRPCNTTKYVFKDRKHVGFADLDSNTIKLRDILKVDLQNILSGGENCENKFMVTIHKLSLDLLDTKNKDFNPDIYIKNFLTNFYSTLLIGDTLPETDPDYNILWEFIDLLYTLLEPSYDGPLRAFPLLRFLPGKWGRVFRATIKARDRVAKRYFDSQKATYREGITRGLVDVCLSKQADDISKTGSSWLTDDYIKGLMYDTMAAGMTEMMKTLRLLILLMCHHQDCQRHVQQEIDDVIGHMDKPSANHRKEMPYTEAVVMEMMRYVSQTPLAIPHKCNKDVIFDGYLIEKDSGIFPNLWGIHHDEAVWGDPWEFRPERFLGNDNKLLPPDHPLMHSFIPFSVGKRRCPGQSFAMSRIFVIFTSLLQQIHFLPPEEEELPSADPRLYTTKYPLYLPLFKCKAVQRTS